MLQQPSISLKVSWQTPTTRPPRWSLLVSAPGTVLAQPLKSPPCAPLSNIPAVCSLLGFSLDFSLLKALSPNILHGQFPHLFLNDTHMNTKVLNATFIPNPSSLISLYNALFFFSQYLPLQKYHVICLFMFIISCLFYPLMFKIHKGRDFDLFAHLTYFLCP